MGEVTRVEALEAALRDQQRRWWLLPSVEALDPCTVDAMEERCAEIGMGAMHAAEEALAGRPIPLDDTRELGRQAAEDRAVCRVLRSIVGAVRSVRDPRRENGHP